MSDRDPVLAAIAALSADIAAFRGDFSSFRGEVASRFDQVEGRLEGVEGRLEGVEGRLGGVEGRLEGVEGRMDSIENTFARFRTDLVEELGNTRGALMARMDRLQDTIRQQQDESVVNHGAAERAERLAQGAAEDVRTLSTQMNALIRIVHSMQEQIRNLQGE